MSGDAQKRRQRHASSDMDESSGDEEDRLEQMMSRHQQRDVSKWGYKDEQQHHNGNTEMNSMNRNDRRDARRDLKRQKRRDEAQSEIDLDQILDTRGTDLPRQSMVPTIATPSSTKKRTDGLLLPGHVEIQSDDEEEEAEERNRESADEDAEGKMGDFIAMDADRSGFSARYYEVEEKEQRMALEECPSCGEKGHDKKSCPHLLCLACGALDEHQTRECPMSLSCFRCGGQGHKANDCKKPRTSGPQGWKDCRRCGATSHVEANCPTHWRIYTYNTVEDHKMERRRLFKEGRVFQGANGGSGKHDFNYRSESDSEEDVDQPENPVDPPRDWDPVVRWCYNCAAQGNHFGDDCPLPRCNPTYTKGDPSVYSEFIASMGPHSRNLPPPPPPDPQAYRNGLRRGDPFDRFDAGPRASMHVYDPQREAMASVDQLFDRHGPGASRRRDAGRRRGERESEVIRPRAPIERKSGQGSKAERYRDVGRERDHQNRRGKRDARPEKVSCSNVESAPLQRQSDRKESSLEIREAERNDTLPPSSSISKVETVQKTKVGEKGEAKQQSKKKQHESKMKKKQDAKMEQREQRKIKAAKKEADRKKQMELKEAAIQKREEKKNRQIELEKVQAINRQEKEARFVEQKRQFEEAQARRLKKGQLEKHAKAEKGWKEHKAHWEKKGFLLPSD